MRGLVEHEPLAPRTTLGVGGRARYYVEVSSEEGVREALAFAREGALSVLPLGGGSNLLVRDEGFDGLVIRPLLKGISRISRADEGGYAVVAAAAGEVWDDLVAWSVANDLAGIECLSGIPGEVGAAPMQNIGAYGQEVAEVITEVRGIDRATGAVVTLGAGECGFGYRDSVFKRALRGALVITEVTFRLRAGGAPKVRYAELVKAVAERGLDNPTLAEVRERVLALRRGKSMVLDPADKNRHSAGSFFTNPVVDLDTWRRVEERARGALAAGEVMPSFDAGAGKRKLSAAWLIDRAGMKRGFGEGRVGLSTRHTLAIVNRGGATAAEVLAFAAEVTRRVEERFGVTLTPEPEIV